MAPKELFDGHERRRFVRLKEPVPVKFRLLNKDNSEPVSGLDWRECHTRDISRSGMCIQISDVDKELKEIITNKSNILELDITLPAEKKVMVKGDINYIVTRGETVWDYLKKRTLEVGIKFTEISDRDEDLITGFITENYIKKYTI